MAAREHGHQRLVDHGLLAVNHFADRFARRRDFCAGCFDFLNGGAARFTECLH